MAGSEVSGSTVPVTVAFRFNVAREKLRALAERPEWKAGVVAGDAATLAANVILLPVADGFRVEVEVPDEEPDDA